MVKDQTHIENSTSQPHSIPLWGYGVNQGEFEIGLAKLGKDQLKIVELLHYDVNE